MTTAPEGLEKGLYIRWFEKAAELYPDHIAISDERANVEISYSALRWNAEMLAAKLLAAGLQKGDIVALALPAGAAYMTAVLAVMKAGGIFMPLDLLAPEQRLSLMLDLTNPRFIISPEDNPLQVDGTENIGILPLKADGQSPEPFTASPAWPELDAADSCYIVFTSGSTGEPKPVLGWHKALVHCLAWEVKEYALDACMVGCMMAPPTFDASFRQKFLPLMTGGRLCIPSEETKQNPMRLLRYIREQRITFYHCVPTVFRLLTDEMRLSEPLDRALADLRNIQISGEALFTEDVRQFRAVAGERIGLSNLYGPTESTLIKCYFRIPDDLNGLPAVVPVGYPISNTRILILDEAQQLCGIGKTGEIYLRSPFLARGYYDQPEKTAERFLPNPLSGDPKDRVYRTGDLGRYLPDHSVEFAGRADRQIKLHGHRIEPGEIEARMQAFPGLKKAVARGLDHNGHTEAIAAWYTVESDFAESELRTWLHEQLPAHMVPAHLLRLPEFPLNRNGKIDQGALPEPKWRLSMEILEAPKGETEEKIAGIWEALLNLDGVDRRADFFACGGNSVKLISLLGRLQHAFGLSLSLPQILERSRLEAQATLIDSMLSGTHAQEDCLSKLSEGEGDPLFLFPPGVGYGLVFGDLSRHFRDRPLYAFDFVPGEGLEVYVQHIASVQPEGKVMLAGYSAGGRLAYHVVRALEESGREVAGLILLDSYRRRESWVATEADMERLTEAYISDSPEHVSWTYVQDEAMRIAVRTRIRAYFQFMSGLADQHQLNAPILLLKGRDSIPPEDGASFDWEDATSDGFMIREGVGGHGDLLSGENLALNAMLLCEMWDGLQNQGKG